MIRVTLLVLLVALGFLAIGYVLVPTGAERALISLKNQDIDEATAQYEERYLEGDRSVGTLSALARIYEAEGRIADAVRLAGELTFAYADPNLALQRQAAIYRAGQEFGRAIEVLEEIPVDRRSPSDMRWLIGQYGLFGQLDPLIVNLASMVDRGIATPDDAVELGRLLAAQQRFDQAIAVLEEQDDRDATLIPPLGQALLVNLLIGQGRIVAARDRAARWAKKVREPARMLVFVAEQMRVAGAPDDAVAVLAPIADQAPHDPDLQAALVESWIAAGEPKTALEAMRSWNAQEDLSDRLVPRLTELALLDGDYAEARALVARDGPEQLGAGLLTGFVDTAQRRGDLPAIRSLDERLPAGYLAGEPILDATIAVALDEPDRANRAIDRALARARSAGDRQRLASLLLALGRTGRALEVMRTAPALDRMPQGYLTQLASLYLAAGEKAEGLALFNSLRGSAKDGRADPGWAIMAAANGQTEAVAAWLAGADGLGTDVLRDLNTAATGAGLPQLALETAQRLAALDDSLDTRLRMVSALLLAGRPGEARAILDKLPADNPEVLGQQIAVLTALGDKAALRRIYAAALDRPGASQAERDEAAFNLLSVGGAAEALDYLEQRAAEPGPGAEAGQWLFAFADAAQQAGQTGRLASFLERELDKPGLTAAETETLLSLLVERAPDAALGFLAVRAERMGGAWAAAYQELLRQRGSRPALIAFLRKEGLDPRTPAERRREAAFGLLDLRNKDGAIEIFQSMAAGGDAQGPDASQLAYLWGPRPEPAALDWIEAQALAADGARRAGWLDLLGRLGGGARLIALVDAGRVTAAAAGEAYLGALLRARRIDALRPALAAAMTRADSATQLRSLAGLAERARQADLAESAWQRLLDLMPDDPEAIRQLAGYAATNGDYDRARALLLRYIALTRPTYSDLYALAEAERAMGLTAEAADRYRQAAGLIDANPKPGFDARIVRAQIAHRLGESGQAIAIFDRLFQERPNDLSLRNDFAEVLLDLGDVARARAVLR
ncbi:MAG: tetratricopeptide repeat protein [Sneathiellaceae bacterium]